MKYRIKLKEGRYFPQFKAMFLWWGWEHEEFKTIPHYYHTEAEARAYIDKRVWAEELVLLDKSVTWKHEIIKY